MISQEELKLFLHYDPETGQFTWLKRTPDMFTDGKRSKEVKCNVWNGKNCGKIAGSVNGEGYISIEINKKSYLAHSLAYLYMTGCIPSELIDHKNTKRNDNKWENLRTCNRSQNGANSVIQVNNTSGYKGVSFHKPLEKWRAQGSINRQKFHLGYYNTAQEAHSVYCKWAYENFGEFGRG